VVKEVRQVRTVAVVGASLAGWSAASALREGGFDGRLILIGEEKQRPYDRPPLSKAFLAGDIGVDLLALTTDESLAEVAPEWLLGRRAVRLDRGGLHRGGRRVLLDDGTEVTADAVVIATGARARALPGSAGLAGVHTLRTIEEATALRAAIPAAERVVVVGGGFIGAEVASTVRRSGKQVDVVEALPMPLVDTFGREMAEVVAGLHAEHGTVLHTGTAVHGLVAAAGVDGPRVAAVKLADGRELAADLVVVGIGVTPNVEWLAGSGVDVDDGVLVDSHGATSVPGVYAAGDVARYPSARAGGHVRVEHWTHARDHGAAVAEAILGRPVEYDPVPYVWSEQYGLMVQFAGYPAPDAEIEVVEGDVTERKFVAVYRHDGRDAAVLGVRSPRTFTKLRRGLARG
jgi:NADPH-dependent 2,4-dienoyl-CoA reductase/sulfur reductase-like enzyme